MKIHLHIDEAYETTDVHIYAPAYNAQIEQLMQRLQANTPDTMIGYKDTDVYVLKMEEVFSVTSEQTKVYIHTEEDEFESRQRLYELENLFPTKLVRINKSTLIHSDKIIAIQSRLLNTPQVVLSNEVTLPISRKYFPLVKAQLGIIHGGDKG